MKFIFWLSLVVPIYCYFGYPLLIFLWAQFFSRPVNKKEYLPSISIVISLWNEQDVIERKVRNLLSLDYPSSKIEFLIGSDGSTDRTNEILQQFRDARIKLLFSAARRGKMATNNELVKMTQGEILIFSDARQIFAADALRQLVYNFADQRIGGVSGELVFGKKEGGTAQGISLYWSYEKFIRRQESRVHSLLGATGAIYAIRRHLYKAVPPNLVLDDMYIPFQVILGGYRVVFDETAKAYDEVAENSSEEHRRKARTIYGNYQIFTALPQMFKPFKSPIAVQLFSHKFLRVVVPFFLIILFIVNLFLLNEGFYQTFFVLQIIFYVGALIGGLARNNNYGILKTISRILYVPYVFCLLNFSALAGFWRFLTAKQQITWQKARS